MVTGFENHEQTTLVVNEFYNSVKGSLIIKDGSGIWHIGFTYFHSSLTHTKYTQYSFVMNKNLADPVIYQNYTEI